VSDKGKVKSHKERKDGSEQQECRVLVCLAEPSDRASVLHLDPRCDHGGSCRRAIAKGKLDEIADAGANRQNVAQAIRGI